MPIRFVDKPVGDPPRKAPRKIETDAAAQADGEARFATPIAAAQPVNPNAAEELPFTELPHAEKVERRKRGRNPAAPRT